MKTARLGLTALILTTLILLAATVWAQPETTAERFWGQWRGPYSTGVSQTADPPTEWSESKNIRWKVEIPGRGSASPVIWGDRLFVLTAIPVSSKGDDAHSPKGGVQPRDLHRFLVMALDRKTGKVIWEQTAKEDRP